MRLSRKSKKGFTLVEVMVAMSLSTLLLASAYATLFSLAKGSESMINFSEMNSQSRFALELFARDMRMASDVLQDDFTTHSVVVRRRQPSGGDQIVRYLFIPASNDMKGHFRRQEWDKYPGNPSTDHGVLKLARTEFGCLKPYMAKR